MPLARLILVSVTLMLASGRDIAPEAQGKAVALSRCAWLYVRASSCADPATQWVERSIYGKVADVLHEERDIWADEHGISTEARAEMDLQTMAAPMAESCAAGFKALLAQAVACKDKAQALK